MQWEGLVLSLPSANIHHIYSLNRDKPWLHPLPFPPTSSHHWFCPCSAHTCSQRSIVSSAVFVSPLTGSSSPRTRPSAPLPPRSYRENAARSWGRETRLKKGRRAETHTTIDLFTLSFVVLDEWWNPVPELFFQFGQSSGRIEGVDC